MNQLPESDLLKPRIKVIAPAPMMKNKVGDLLYRQEYKNKFSFGILANDAEHFYPLEAFEEWTHIFKICEWYEDRKEIEMPKYVKDHMGKIHNVSANHRGLHQLQFRDEKFNHPRYYYNTTPATFEEWKEYNLTLQK